MTPLVKILAEALLDLDSETVGWENTNRWRQDTEIMRAESIVKTLGEKGYSIIPTAAFGKIKELLE